MPVEPFSIDPELIENDKVRITELNGELAIEYIETGTTLRLGGDNTTTVDNIDVEQELEVNGLTDLRSGVVVRGNFNITGNNITEASAVGASDNLVLRTGPTDSTNSIFFRDDSTGNDLAILDDSGDLDVEGIISTNGYNIFVQDTEPTAENVGDVWIDNSEAFE